MLYLIFEQQEVNMKVHSVHCSRNEAECWVDALRKDGLNFSVLEIGVSEIEHIIYYSRKVVEQWVTK